MSTRQRTTPRWHSLQVGDEFERLTVIGPPEVRIVGVRRHRKYYYPCRCVCGKETVAESSNLLSGAVRSCGCLRKDASAYTHRKHGQSRSRLYGVWSGIIARCGNPNSESYHNYGARGITMCHEWRESFEAFQSWALANGYKRGLTVERKNNDGPYSPENCVFASRQTQARNKRTSVMLTAFGDTKTLMEWSEDPRANASYGLIHWRITRGIDPETAITLPPDSRRKILNAS